MEPLGDVERHDLAWVSLLQEIISDNEPLKVEQAARSYWDGKPWPTKDNSLFEGLCREARVIRVWGEDDEPDQAWAESEAVKRVSPGFGVS